MRLASWLSYKRLRQAFVPVNPQVPRLETRPSKALFSGEMAGFHRLDPAASPSSDEAASSGAGEASFMAIRQAWIRPWPGHPG